MSNKILIATISATLGAAVGSVVTWKVLKTKYEQIAQEEIESVREVYSKKLNHVSERVKEAHAALTADDKNNYSQITNLYKGEGGEESVNEHDKPRVISPDDFGDNEDYETVSLTLYSDGVLENDFGEIIEEDDIENTIGKESLNRFGEFEDDAVYVINDALETYYEILADVRTYNEAYSEDSDE